MPLDLFYTHSAWQSRLESFLEQRPPLYRAVLPSDSDPSAAAAPAPSTSGRSLLAASSPLALVSKADVQPLSEDERGAVIASNKQVLSEFAGLLGGPAMLNSKLVSRDGRKLREGSTLIAVLGEDGQLMLKGKALLVHTVYTATHSGITPWMRAHVCKCTCAPVCVGVGVAYLHMCIQ